jgi:D-serine deaminase-like pyridoxal phosphate-dependent protein
VEVHDRLAIVTTVQLTPPSAPELPGTPFLVVDEAVLDRNITDLATRFAGTGIRLRPHVKTHKCIEIARKQRDGGATGITVATLGEAEVFAAAGFDDIFVAYPLWLDDEKARRAVALGEQVRLRIGVDSVASAANAAVRLGGHPVEVLVEVDCGHHRSGVPPREAGRLAADAVRQGLTVAGVFTFPGHSYAEGGRARAALEESVALAEAAAALAEVGVEPAVVSGGSTPSIEYATPSSSGTGTEQADGVVLTEARPGVYVFGDAQQWELGSCPPDRIALTARATVVSHAGGRVVLDSGSKILGADRAPFASGFGRLLDHPEARIVQLSEHHAVADLAGHPLPPLGSRVRVVPNHVCTAVNLVDELLVADHDRIVARWPVAARGRNS